MNSTVTNPNKSALIGILFFLPFLIMNAIVGSRIEPFYSFLRPEGAVRTGIFEYALLAILFLLILFGAFVAARPMLQKGVDGKRKFYLLNFILAVILFAIFLALTIGVGSDIYRCDVLHIPNCD